MADVVVLTPPELAKRWRVSPDKILSMIGRGDLAAFNVASNPAGRPRWRIRMADVEAFETGRAAAPREPKRRRRRKVGQVTEYF